ncbi:putative F-box/kelch-repeat protein At1g27420 [Brassica napus]|uniref:putative F-box/kelch-repeat protein At1g27420 n=1 Tax=Brassica napus TaxID=3708 RepID=UPI0006AB13FB|nr:putative F-box/kelch-repeat protein At1g27420 [Brassica napus]
MEESSTSIIPGLTDDVAALCLSRIPRSNFRVLSQVCRRWKTFLRSEHFAAVRKLTGTMEEFMCVFMKSIRGRKVYWEVFDSSGNNLGQIPPFPGPLKRGFCVAVIGGEKILFIGGYTGMKYWDFSRIPPIASGDINEFSLSTKRNPPLASADVYEFNPATNSWRKLADMNIPRYDFSLAEVDGLLYVVQGFSNDGYCLFNTEVYNPQTNQWSLMDGPVAFPIGGFAFSFKSKLYAVANGSTTMNIYDPKTETWEELDLKQLLSVHSNTVVRNIVYFLDQNSGCLGVFDPEENSWTDEFLPTVEGGYRSGLGQWNNKVLLFSRLSVRETLINGFDKEEGFKWRDCDQIKPSGSYLIHVLINF